MAKKKYNIGITRISYSSKEFTVEAESKTEAKMLALQQAANTVFYEDDAHYEIDNIKVHK